MKYREVFIGSYYQLTEQGWAVVAVYKRVAI